MLLFSLFSVNVQKCNECSCWLSKVDRKVQKTSNCNTIEILTYEETLDVINSLLNQKGNKASRIGVVLRNSVSQDFGWSPYEVVALFYTS